MNHSRRWWQSPSAALGLVGVMLGGTALWLELRGEPAVAPAQSSPLTASWDCETPEWVEAERSEAELRWTDAITGWEDVIGRLPHDSPCRADVERRLELCREQRQRTLRPQADATPIVLEGRSPAQKPAPVPSQTLVDHYPVGRTVRSAATAQITGRGTNKAWGLQSEGHFDWRLTVNAVTQITACYPETGQLTVRQEFGEVSQLLVVRDRSFSLEVSPALLLAPIDQLASRVRHYAVARNGMLAWKQLDPEFRLSLTFVALHLGWDKDEFIVPEGTLVAQQLEQLSGAIVEYDYVSGFGVASIRLLNSETKSFSPEELKRLADSLSVMLDYHILPVLERPTGEPWPVRVEDVAGLFAAQGMEAQATGRLTLARDATAGTTIPLRILSGDVTLLAIDPTQQHHEARFTVRSGQGQFSADDYLLTSASLELGVQSLWQLPRALLFRTEAIRDLRAQVEYRAGRIPPPADVGSRRP